MSNKSQSFSPIEELLMNSRNSRELLQALEAYFKEIPGVYPELLLYSEDLDSFFFPPDTKEEKRDGYRKTFIEKGITLSGEKAQLQSLPHIIREIWGEKTFVQSLDYGGTFLGYFLLMGDKDKEIIEEAKTKSNIFFICQLILYIHKVELERERIALEKELMSKNALRGENLKLLGELLGSITHDLNNVFTGIIGYSQLLEMMLEDEDLRDSLAEVLKASHKGREYIRFIQEHKKIDAREEPSEIFLEPLLKYVFQDTGSHIKTLYPETAPGDIFSLRVDYDPSLNLPPVMTRQFFFHLLTGILQQGKGKIDIELSRYDKGLKVEIKYPHLIKNKPHTPIKYSVSGDFSDFFAISLLSRQLDFDFRLYPHRAEILIPLQKDDGLPLNFFDSSSKKLLVYEPHESVSAMFGFFFKKYGIEGYVFQQGEPFIETLKSLTEGDLALVISDVSLYPSIIANMPPDFIPPILLCSSWGPLLSLAHIDASKISDILAKPFTLNQLGKVLIKYLT